MSPEIRSKYATPSQSQEAKKSAEDEPAEDKPAEDKPAEN